MIRDVNVSIPSLLFSNLISFLFLRWYNVIWEKFSCHFEQVKALLLERSRIYISGISQMFASVSFAKNVQDGLKLGNRESRLSWSKDSSSDWCPYNLYSVRFTCRWLWQKRLALGATQWHWVWSLTTTEWTS